MDRMKCPKCDSKNVVPILYGYPNAKGIDDVKAGKMVLGGCIIRGNDPRHYCRDCKSKF